MPRSNKLRINKRLMQSVFNFKSAGFTFNCYSVLRFGNHFPKIDLAGFKISHTIFELRASPIPLKQITDQRAGVSQGRLYGRWEGLRRCGSQIA